jgi:hypothetical protein
MRWLTNPTRSTRPLWLNDTDYTYQLLANGPDAWLNPTAFAQWRRQALKLLNPGVAVLDVAGVAQAWAAAAASTNLLRDPAFMSHLSALLRVLRDSTDEPLALYLPPPPPKILSDEDKMDDLAGDMARLLRAQSEAGIDIVLLREPGPDLSYYTSLTNTAHHYRWDIGIHTPAGAPSNLGTFDFAVAPVAAAGVQLGSAFWEGAPAPTLEAGHFYFTEVPADASPEHVLVRLGSLS